MVGEAWWERLGGGGLVGEAWWRRLGGGGLVGEAWWGRLGGGGLVAEAWSHLVWLGVENLFDPDTRRAKEPGGL